MEHALRRETGHTLLYVCTLSLLYLPHVCAILSDQYRGIVNEQQLLRTPLCVGQNVLASKQ